MIRVIVAISKNQVIGVDNALPWHIKEEMAHFQRETTRNNNAVDNVVLMGRKTWESLPERYRPLPNRFNAVVSSQAIKGAHTCTNNINSFLEYAAASKDINVIGGGQIYKHFLENNLADEVVVSVIDKDIPEVGNVTKFEGFEVGNYRLKESRKHDEFIVLRYVKR